MSFSTYFVVFSAVKVCLPTKWYRFKVWNRIYIQHLYAVQTASISLSFIGEGLGNSNIKMEVKWLRVSVWLRWNILCETHCLTCLGVMNQEVLIGSCEMS